MSIQKQTSISADAPLVLLVEDNTIALHLIESIVNQAGCRFISATKGEQALKLAQTIEFELIITDIGLPGISGTTLTSLIREWEVSLNKKEIPIIGLTAQSLNESETACLKAGMNKVLSKPIYLKEMQALVIEFIKTNTAQKASENEEPSLAFEQHPLFDYAEAMKNIGDEIILRDLLSLMNEKVIPEDKAMLEKAYQDKAWEIMRDLAHKMKSGALYCGAIRMQFVCLKLERLKKQDIALIDEIYQQLILVLNDTKCFLETWLANRTNHKN